MEEKIILTGRGITASVEPYWREGKKYFCWAIHISMVEQDGWAHSRIIHFDEDKEIDAAIEIAKKELEEKF